MVALAAGAALLFATDYAGNRASCGAGYSMLISNAATATPTPTPKKSCHGNSWRCT